MAEDLGGLLVVTAILCTFGAHLYYLAIRRRDLGFVAKVAGVLMLYVLGIVAAFFSAVGLCAAGCPATLDSRLVSSMSVCRSA